MALALEHDAECVPWTASFPLTTGTLDALLAKFRVCDFGVFILAGDDKASIREKDFAVARDNVLFEAGLFMGMQGKGRTFLVTPRDAPGYHLATDLSGITTTGYDPDRVPPAPRAALTNVATEVRLAMTEAFQPSRHLDIETEVQFSDKYMMPLKLLVKLRNDHAAPVALRSISFEPAPNVRMASNWKRKKQRNVPTFLWASEKVAEIKY